MRWCLGTRLLVAGALLWLAFVLADLALSGRWWLWLVVDALPPPTFVFAPVMLLAVLGIALWRGVPVPRGGRWWVILPTAVALVIGIGNAGLNPGALWAAPERAPAADAVRVMSWNTEYWAQSDDPDEFYAFLKRQRADVYLLQEYVHHVDGEHDPAMAHTPVYDERRLHQEFPGYTVIARGELVTLSRFPVVARPLVGPDRESYPDWPTEFEWAKVLRTDLAVGSAMLSVYNVHIPVQFDLDISPLSGEFYRFMARAAGQRRQQLDGLRADVDGNRNPLLIAGDFNTSPSMGDLDGLRASVSDAVRASDAVYPASWYQAGGLLGWRLDWAFTAHDVRVHSYEFSDPRELSDHHPQHLVVSLASVRAQARSHN